jgi:hypothetical protein
MSRSRKKALRRSPEVAYATMAINKSVHSGLPFAQESMHDESPYTTTLPPCGLAFIWLLSAPGTAQPFGVAQVSSAPKICGGARE